MESGLHIIRRKCYFQLPQADYSKTTLHIWMIKELSSNGDMTSNTKRNVILLTKKHPAK